MYIELIGKSDQGESEMTVMETGRRRVPAARFRRFRDHLSPGAVAAGDATGLSVDGYRRNRNENYTAVDVAVYTQTRELSATLRGDSYGRNSRFDSFFGALYSVTDRNSPRYYSTTDAEDAATRRSGATAARELAGELRRLAGIADAIAVGLELRAEDDENMQAITDFLDAVRDAINEQDD